MADAWSKIAARFGELAVRIRREGWRRAPKGLAETLIGLAYNRTEYVVFRRPLDQPSPVVHPPCPLTMRRASERDLERLRELVTPVQWRHFARRLTHGRHCFLALAGDDLAAYAWTTTAVDLDIDGIELKLQPGDVYIDDIFTFPAYQRLGIQSALRQYLFDRLRDLGFRQTIGIVDGANAASLGLTRKFGGEVAGRMTFQRILWVRTFRYRPTGVPPPP